MEKHDVEGTQKWIEETNRESGIKFDEGVQLVSLLEVERELRTRKHTFSCGGEGEVVDELIVKFKFPKGKIDLQPSDDFAENAVDFMIESLKNSELTPWIETIDE